jgi:hypothetical protein
VLTSCPTTSRIRPCCTWHRVMDTLGSYTSACFYDLKQTRHETRRMPSAARGGLLSSIHDVLALTGLCRHEPINSDAQRRRQMQLWRNGTKSKLCDAPHRRHCHCTTRRGTTIGRSCDDKKRLSRTTERARGCYIMVLLHNFDFRLTRPSL